ncbi:Transmembrane protein [Hirschfeldia incana]|nr:Transmembrane protein [Hirschfeldia incana]
MASRFFLVFLLVTLTIVDATLAAEAEKLQPVVDTKKAADNATKSLIDSLGPSQDNPDYEIPLELAPGGVQVVEDYNPNMSPTGAKDDSLAQPEADMNVNASPSSSASIYFSTAAVAAVGGASFFFF